MYALVQLHARGFRRKGASQKPMNTLRTDESKYAEVAEVYHVSESDAKLAMNTRLDRMTV